MPIRILGASREVPAQINYLPKAGCSQRQFVVSRADSAFGKTTLRPLILCDTGFWNQTTYPDVIEAIADSGMRVWNSTDDGARKSPGGAAGIAGGTWTELRRVAAGFSGTVMIGLMMAVIRYKGFMDIVVTAAPNMLFKSTTRQYLTHTAGDNEGTQIHAEMVMAAQLEAFHSAITTSRQTPVVVNPNSTLETRIATAPQAVMVPKPGQTPTGGGRRTATAPVETEEAMLFDVDMFIEKGTLCEGCAGTWRKIFTQPARSNPPVKCEYRI